MTDCKDNKRLIERLRERANMARDTHPVDAEMDDRAADALEAMQKENEKLVDIVEVHMGGIEVLQKRIAELEAKLYRKNERIKAWQKSSDEHEARVEELEGDLEVMRLQRDAKRWTSENHDN